MLAEGWRIASDVDENAVAARAERFGFDASPRAKTTRAAESPPRPA